MPKKNIPLLFIVSGGILQIPAVFQAKELGLLVAVSDRNPDAPAMKYADIPVMMNTWDVKGHIRETQKLAKKYNLVGIYTQGADVEVTVAKMAKALGLPGTDPQAAMNCKNKALMRKVFEQKKINQIPFAEVKNIEEVKIAVKKIGFPVIFKNIDNSASRGTSVVNKESQIEEAFKSAKEASKTKSALIEKFLTGPEQSVDMIVYKGKYYPAGICDRQFSTPPYRVEIGHVNLTSVPRKTQQKIYQLAEKSGRALGIDFGVAKADLILTAKGPFILEMTNRLSGGFDSQYTKPYATGMNLIRPTIKMAIGAKPDWDDLRIKWNRISACLAIFPKRGIIKDIHGVDGALRIPGVTNVIITARIGDKIDKVENSADRIGFVITIAKTRREAIKSAKTALNKIKILYEKIQR